MPAINYARRDLIARFHPVGRGDRLDRSQIRELRSSSTSLRAMTIEEFTITSVFRKSDDPGNSAGTRQTSTWPIPLARGATATRNEPTALSHDCVPELPGSRRGRGDTVPSASTRNTRSLLVQHSASMEQPQVRYTFCMYVNPGDAIRYQGRRESTRFGRTYEEYVNTARITPHACKLRRTSWHKI